MFAFGEIDALFEAQDLEGNPLGGRIASVGAVDRIWGVICAEHSIGTVRSGGAITAEIPAAQISQTIANDATRSGR